MSEVILPIVFQVFYIIIPTISIIGNSLIIYVTIVSSLRSMCNILIALISVGDVMQMFGHYVMVISYNVISDHLMLQAICVYWQLIPVCGIFLSASLLLTLAIDRLLSLQKF
ncbi:hypothetical protein COOONC_13943 [Cooperia oncophora]